MRSKFLAAFLLCLPALATQRVDVKTTEAADFAAGGTVRIEGSTGDVNIEGWDQPRVEIEVVRSQWSDRANEARKRLNEIVVTTKREGRELTISTAHKRWIGAQVSYRIHVPVNTKLVVHHGTGAVVIFGVESDIEASTKVGDVVVQLREPAKYRIDAFTKLGGIYSDFGGKVVRRRLGTGESLNPAVADAGEERKVSLRVGTGGITIQKVTV